MAFAERNPTRTRGSRPEESHRRAGRGGALIAALITPAGTASASCDAADCVANVAHNVVGGTPCVPQTVFDFGLDSKSKTYVCARTGTWLPAGPLVGMREVALPCDAIDQSAQDSNGSRCSARG